jgi:hypothetical protein
MNTFNQVVRGIALATALAIVAPVLTSMPAVATEVQVTKHTYVYYGDHDIYFAPDTKVWFYREDGTGAWKSAETLPDAFQPYVKTKGITISLNTERPYEQHEYVVKTYKVKHHDDD